MNFDDIPLRMAKLGVDRAWLAKQCDYSASTLANALAPKGTNKTEKALRRIWEALDREEERQCQNDVIEGFFSLSFTPQQFAEVDAASRRVDAQSIKQYCHDCVMVRTREIMNREKNEDCNTSSLVAEDTPEYGTKNTEK